MGSLMEEPGGDVLDRCWDIHQSLAAYTGLGFSRENESDTCLVRVRERRP